MITGIPEQVMDWRLCYADNPFLYFCHPEDYDTVTGEDWNDAPYWCNSGTPNKPCYIVAVQWMYEPAKYFSVDDIRAGRGWFLEYGIDCKLRAGITLAEFLELAKRNDLCVYVPLDNGFER
jgi:hypothetical protein